MSRVVLQVMFFLIAVYLVGFGFSEAGIFSRTHDMVFSVTDSSTLSRDQERIAELEDEVERLQNQIGLDVSQGAVDFQLISSGQVAGAPFDRLGGRTLLRVRGLNDQVRSGDTVIVGDQLIGRVELLRGGGEAQVAMLTHNSVRPAVFVSDQPRLEGVIVPNEGGLSIQHLPADLSSLQALDEEVVQLETSGLSGIYPKGLSAGSFRLSEQRDGSFQVTLDWHPNEIAVVSVVR